MSSGARASGLREGAVLAGRFQVIRPLGQGGMGAVYEATQLDIGRSVAIKTLLPEYADDVALVERFRREARAAARLRHPNIVPTTGFYAEQGEPPFLVMELVDGRSLKALLDGEPRFAPERVCNIAIQVLDALAAAHADGIVHRDLKPGNLLVGQTLGIRDYVRLLDFGLAKVVDEDRIKRLTQTGALLGTPGFMAPEQARGTPVDARADLYATGVVVFRAITGRLPYDAEGPGPLLVALVRDRALPISRIIPTIDPRIDALVARALEKEPDKRFASAREMQDAFLALDSRGRVSSPRMLATRVSEPAPERAPAPAQPDPAPTVKLVVRTLEPAPVVRFSAPKVEARAPEPKIEKKPAKKKPRKRRIGLAITIGLVLAILPWAASLVVIAVPAFRKRLARPTPVAPTTYLVDAGLPDALVIPPTPAAWPQALSPPAGR